MGGFGCIGLNLICLGFVVDGLVFCLFGLWWFGCVVFVCGFGFLLLVDGL